MGAVLAIRALGKNWGIVPISGTAFADHSGSVPGEWNGKAMRILLQDPKTNLYFQYPNAWVAQVTEAFGFASSSDVEQWHRLLGLFDATLVFQFDEEGYSIRVPLHAKGEDAAMGAGNGERGMRLEGAILADHDVEAAREPARP